jgi:putative NIF3 family GTP cyclohydrolase 1 type 2
VNTDDLVARLNAFLDLDRYPTDDFAVLPDFCGEAGIPIEEYATPAFLQRFNGLMLDNADEVACVFTLVFPCDEVLAEVERRAGGQPALIFTHHPMDMETSGRGLVPVGTEWLQRLRLKRISLYSAHVPLDCHETASTSRALARAVGVPAETAFAGYHGGHAGVHGHIDPIPFEEFVERVRRVCGIDHLETKRAHERVRHVAVVAGGAAYPALMQEALDASSEGGSASGGGCDTYLTGDFRVRHGGPWAEEHRPQFDAFVEKVPLNLIGGSHYATEALVLRHDMLSFFGDLALPAEFVPQSDPWR